MFCTRRFRAQAILRLFSSGCRYRFEYSFRSEISKQRYQYPITAAGRTAATCRKKIARCLADQTLSVKYVSTANATIPNAGRSQVESANFQDEIPRMRYTYQGQNKKVFARLGSA